MMGAVLLLLSSLLLPPPAAAQECASGYDVQGAANEQRCCSGMIEVIEELGLESAKPVGAPGVRDGGPAIRGAEDLLSAADVAIYMRCVGKLIYLSVDRYDIACVVRLLAQALREPRQGWARAARRPRRVDNCLRCTFTKVHMGFI